MQDLQKQLLENYTIEIRSYQDNTIEDIPSFLKQINKITSTENNSIIQLVDTDYVCGEEHIYQAISQVVKSFDEKQNFAKDKGLEICVRLSAQKQISEALKLLGIKNKGNITAIYINTTDKQITDVEKLMADRNDSLLEKYDVDTILEAYDLYDSKDIVNQINEKIALLTLKN